MITTSHKPQAKRITTRTLYSSTDVTNFIKIKTQWSWWSSTDVTNFIKISTTRSWRSSTDVTNFLKIKTQWTPASSLESLFFIIKSNKPAASSPVNA